MRGQRTMYPKSRKGVEPGPCDKKESQQLAADEYQYGAPTQSNAEADPLAPAQGSTTEKRNCGSPQQPHFSYPARIFRAPKVLWCHNWMPQASIANRPAP